MNASQQRGSRLARATIAKICASTSGTKIAVRKANILTNHSVRCPCHKEFNNPGGYDETPPLCCFRPGSGCGGLGTQHAFQRLSPSRKTASAEIAACVQCLRPPQPAPADEKVSDPDRNIILLSSFDRAGASPWLLRDLFKEAGSSSLGKSTALQSDPATRKSLLRYNNVPRYVRGSAVAMRAKSLRALETRDRLFLDTPTSCATSLPSSRAG